MITQIKAQNKLLEIANAREFKFQNWQGKKFSIMKEASTTEKGDIGEDFLAELLKLCGYEKVEVVKGRRGHYDVSVELTTGTTVKFEVKVATKDSNGNFQFNGIRYDTKYTHLFCLGISPDKIDYRIIEKRDLDNYTLVSMARGSNATFKLTLRESDLYPFGKFEADIKAL